MNSTSSDIKAAIGFPEDEYSYASDMSSIFILYLRLYDWAIEQGNTHEQALEFLKERATYEYEY
jgi:hypothetical protein